MSANQSILTDQLRDLLVSWSKDPVAFVREALKVERITGQQVDGLEKLRDIVWAKILVAEDKPGTVRREHRKLAKKIGISIMAGRGPGKDTFASWAILWFMVCFERVIIPCTAPSGHQLSDILWREINKWLEPSILTEWLTWQSKKLFLTERGGKDWMAVARTYNPNASLNKQGETLSGFHEDYMMIVIDEASGVNDVVFTPLDGTLTGKCNFILSIFNPTKTSGFAYDSQYKNRDDWVCLRWNAEDSEIVSRDSIEKKAKAGKDSNYYRVNVLGLPPKAERDALIPYEWAESSKTNPIEALDTDVEVFGVDIGAGGDPSCILCRRGPIIEWVELLEEEKSELVTDWILGKIYKHDPKYVFVDTIGFGWGIAGNLRRRTSSNIIGVMVSESATNDIRFKRLRDELWWRVRESFENKNIRIVDQGELTDDFVQELTTIKYTEPDGKVKVESKQELLRRGLKSPNMADALCLTEYYSLDMIREVNHTRSYQQQYLRKHASWRTV